ncbi:hypothetical protein IW138_001325 [Coemansia sp. RSA 986]|nr:hypothetical protein IW138_001325 [Coemansia sp. RSA 986]
MAVSTWFSVGKGKFHAKNSFRKTTERDSSERSLGYKLLLGNIPVMKREAAWYSQAYPEPEMRQCPRGHTDEAPGETREHFLECTIGDPELPASQIESAIAAWTDEYARKRTPMVGITQTDRRNALEALQQDMHPHQQTARNPTAAMKQIGISGVVDGVPRWPRTKIGGAELKKTAITGVPKNDGSMGFKHQAKFEHLGIEAPKGVLLYGPPGVGKTRLVQKIAELTNSHLTVVQGADIVGPYLGESEKKLRDVFAQAQRKVTDHRASILFIDEIDALAGNREKQQQGNVGVRVVAQLLTLMDGVESRGRLVVVGATNLPNSLDPALRRPGRFDREVHVDVPGTEARLAILRYYTRGMALGDDVDLHKLAGLTSGYVGADIGALCREAAVAVIGLQLKEGLSGDQAVGMREFTEAMKHTVPALRRGLAIDVGDTRWQDIGGLDELKQTMQRVFDWPQNHQAAMHRLGVHPVRGILMYGPPGCSKTTVVKALAHQEEVSFFSINGASIYSPYVGDAERTVRRVFRQARAASPSVVFFDEIDAIVGKRQQGTQGDAVQERMLSTMLNEMDGVEATHGVLVVGATNRIDMLDPALLRPGRFDKIVYVPPPDHAARMAILRIKMRAMPADLSNADVDALATRTEGYSGADLDNVCREAALLALRHDIHATSVGWGHFEHALGVVEPSLTAQVMLPYNQAHASFGG